MSFRFLPSKNRCFQEYATRFIQQNPLRRIIFFPIFTTLYILLYSLLLLLAEKLLLKLVLKLANKRQRL